MSYVVFDSGDTPYLEWLSKNPSGYVLNTRRGRGAQFAMIHLATCSHIASTAGIPTDGYTTRDDIKVCALDIDDLLTFLSGYKTLSIGTIDPCRSCKATTEPMSYGRSTGATRKPWSREELLVLCNLYEKIDFGKFHSRNPVLIEVAQRMGRTPASISMKLGNFGSLDPRLHARGIKGLSGASALDRSVWQEFHEHRNELAPEGQALLNVLITGAPDAEVTVLPESGLRVRQPPTGASTAKREVETRNGQDYFRDVVLNHYGRRCAVTGLSIEQLLVASHIVPWSKREDSRYDERNGIALNVLHDKAFDRGLITFDTELRLVCAPSLRDHFAEATAAQHFKAYEGKPLAIPAAPGSLTGAGAAGPKPEYLAWHRDEVFGKS